MGQGGYAACRRRDAEVSEAVSFVDHSAATGASTTLGARRVRLALVEIAMRGMAIPGDGEAQRALASGGEALASSGKRRLINVGSGKCRHVRHGRCELRLAEAWPSRAPVGGGEAFELLQVEASCRKLQLVEA